MKQSKTEERNREMEAARKNGETYVAIAKRHGLSAGRVAQLIKKRALRRQMMEDGTGSATNSGTIG